MKKIIYAFTVCAVVLFTGSCSKDETEMFTAEEIEEYNFQKVELKKINDYLFEVTNNDFYTRYYFNPYSVGDEFMGLKEWHGVFFCLLQIYYSFIKACKNTPSRCNRRRTLWLRSTYLHVKKWSG